jgi:hypothetical protein
LKRWLLRGLLLAIVAGAAFWGWRLWFPGPEQIIRKQLAELARLASVAPNEAPLKKLAAAQELAGLFTKDVDISVDVPGRSTFTINGREEVRETALGTRSMGTTFTVEFVDVEVTVAPDRQNAVVRLTAKANVPGETMPQVQELKLEFKKVDNDWLVHHVETVRTLH